MSAPIPQEEIEAMQLAFAEARLREKVRPVEAICTRALLALSFTLLGVVIAAQLVKALVG